MENEFISDVEILWYNFKGKMRIKYFVFGENVLNEFLLWLNYGGV